NAPKPAATQPALKAVASTPAPVSKADTKPPAKPTARPAAASKPLPEAPASAFSFPPAFSPDSLPRPETIAAPLATMMGIGADGARKSFEQAQASSETLRQACIESANAASRGMLDLNTQMLDLMRAQSDATMGMLRSAMSAPSFSEALKVQTSGARQAYEATAAHLKIIAETTTRVVGETTKPIQSAFNDRTRK
ncbi:MAG TPA: phasin family protein, partial [Saliniramus sp.]|nr:phasin family protein [Saliniramus sp.]